MRVLIADDEPLARARLRRLVEDLGEHVVVAEAADGEEALALAEQLAPELILLDIRMPGLDGLAAAERLKALARRPAVIYTTAFAEHALAAFEAEALDYLVKPVRRERLLQALERAARRAAAAPLTPTHVVAHHLGGVRRIPIEEVLFFRSEQKYVVVRYRQGEVVLETSLRALEEEFGPLFVRVHRNALVALAQVAALRRTPGGRHEVVLRDWPEALEVSRRHLAAVRRCLGQVG
ncbi:response regulator transcription factor [Ectothiorhodospiraceae bacterium 2226]|nr:response regulator transcription factor [Ectothiorhodospiraceae bacterium 2226]